MIWSTNPGFLTLRQFSFYKYEDFCGKTMNVNAIMIIRQIDKIRFVNFSWFPGIFNSFWKISSNWQNTNCLHFMICRNYQQLSGEKNVVFCQFDDFFHAFWKVVSGFRKFINFWKDSSSLFTFSRTSVKFSQFSKVVKLMKYNWFTSARCNFTYYFSISQFERKSRQMTKFCLLHVVISRNFCVISNFQ